MTVQQMIEELHDIAMSPVSDADKARLDEVAATLERVARLPDEWLRHANQYTHTEQLAAELQAALDGKGES